MCLLTLSTAGTRWGCHQLLINWTLTWVLTDSPEEQDLFMQFSCKTGTFVFTFTSLQHQSPSFVPLSISCLGQLQLKRTSQACLIVTEDDQRPFKGSWYISVLSTGVACVTPLASCVLPPTWRGDSGYVYVSVPSEEHAWHTNWTDEEWRLSIGSASWTSVVPSLGI